MVENIETKHLTIGSSAGGVSAALAIREAKKTGKITLISDEPYAAYSRPMIAEYLAGECQTQDMAYRSDELHGEDNIVALSGQRAEKLDVKEHKVYLSDGRIIAWEKLLLATGGMPIIPQTPGMEKKGVFSFTTLNDARNIRDYIDTALAGSLEKQAVVIGGGLIGLSVSEALTKLGIKVTVVEMRDYLLNTILDAETGTIAGNAVKKAGLSIITGHTVTEIEDGTTGTVGGVVLDDGSRLPCQMAILAIGVRPNTTLAIGTGLRVNRGILVDRHMATNIQDIYACGDAAQAYDFVMGDERLSPVWPNACTGGRIAGLNMAGTASEYTGGTAMNSIKYFGLEIASAGMVNPPDSSYETVRGAKNGSFRKLILKEGRICGMVFAGNIEKCGIVFGLMKEKVDVSSFKNLLVADELNLAALPDEIWQKRIRLPA